MKELDEYRAKLIDRLGQAAAEFRRACLAVADPLRSVDGGWNVHQLAAHTRDVDKMVYGARARRTLTEDDPLFANFDGDAYMAAHYDPDEPLPRMLDELQAGIGSLVVLLRDMPVEGWSRPARHETQGDGFTLQTWVERSLQHIEEHLATVEKAGRLSA